MTSAPVAQNESVPAGCTEHNQNGVAAVTSVAKSRVAGGASVSAGDSASSGSPPPVYLVRHDSGIDVYGEERSESLLEKSDNQHCTAEENLNSDVLKPALSLREEVFNAVWSPDGIHLAVNTAKNGVVVYSHPTWKVPLKTAVVEQKLLRFPTSVIVPPRSLRYIQWSPLGTFLVGFWQYDGRSNVAPPPDERNVLVWKILNDGSKKEDASEREDQLRPIVGFTLRGISIGQWPVLKWRSDEMFCCLTSRSDIVVYDGKDPGGRPLQRVPISGVVQAQPAPPEAGNLQTKLMFSGFSPSTQDSAAAFYVVEVTWMTHSSNGLSSGSWRIVTERVLEDVDSAEMRWNCSGSSVVLLANATVDAAGENYGGVGDAYLAKIDGSPIMKVNQKVALEACWSPVRNEFILIEGKSPSEIRLYDENGKVLYAFPNAYCNTVRWDAFGCMLALGGFGNLAGDLSFWYRDAEKNSQQLITQWREGCTVLCEWAPEGSFFFTASTYPRMKVDNNFKIFTYEGRMLIKREFAELFDIQWKPVSSCTILRVPERPTPQAIAPQQSRKFRASRESVGGPDGKRPTPQVAFSAAVASTPTASPALNVTLAAARNEKNRQIQAMMDWRSREPAGLLRTANLAAVPGAGGGTTLPQQGASKPDAKSRVAQGLTKSSGGMTGAPKVSDASKITNQSSVTKSATSTLSAPIVTPTRAGSSVRTPDEKHGTTPQAADSALAQGESVISNIGTNEGSTRALEPRELMDKRDGSFFRQRDREMQMMAFNAGDVEQHHNAEKLLPSTMLTEAWHKEDRGSAHVDSFANSIDSGLVSTPHTRGVGGQQEPTANMPSSSDPLEGPQTSEFQQGLLQNIAPRLQQESDGKQPGLLSLLKRILPPTAQVHVEPFSPFENEAASNGHSSGVIAKPQPGSEKPNVWAGEVVSPPASSSSIDEFGRFLLNQKQHQVSSGIQHPLFSAAYESAVDRGLWSGRKDNFFPVLPQQDCRLNFAVPGPPPMGSVPTPNFLQEAQQHQRGWNINHFHNGTGSLKPPGGAIDSTIRDIRQASEGSAALLRHHQPNLSYQQEAETRLALLRQQNLRQQQQPQQSDEETHHDAFLLQRELHYHQQRRTAHREQLPLLSSTIDGFHERNTGRRTGPLDTPLRGEPISKVEAPSSVSYPPLPTVANGPSSGSAVSAGDATQRVNEVEKLLQVLRHIGRQPLSEQHDREGRLVAGHNASEASKNKMVDQSSSWSLPTKPAAMFSGVASEPRPHSYSQFSQIDHTGHQVPRADSSYAGAGSDANLPHNTSFLPGWHQIGSTPAVRPTMPAGVRPDVDRNFFDRQANLLPSGPLFMDVGPQRLLTNSRPPQAIPDGRPELSYGGSLGNGPPKLSKNSGITSDPMSDVCWEYVDLKGMVRGPFHANDMRKWFCAGYFSDTLPVRYSKTAPFKALRELFANEDASFAEPPSATQPERYPGSLTQHNYPCIVQQNRLFPPGSSNAGGELPPERTSETSPATGAPSSSATSPFMSFS